MTLAASPLTPPHGFHRALATPPRRGFHRALAALAVACALLAPAPPAWSAQASVTSLVAAPSPGRMDQPSSFTITVGLGFDTSAPASGKLSVGAAHACAVTAAGGVMCWGDNFDGQLGDGTKVDRWLPAAVKTAGGAPLTGVKAVAAGGSHTCALLAAGTVACWGYNEYGQLGTGSFNSEPFPVSVAGLSGVAAVAAGELHTCALLKTGIARCWGFNAYGQIGTGVQTPLEPTPVGVSGLADATTITAGGSHTCAVLKSGTAKCWGRNVYGQVGSGQSGGSVPTPTTVVGVGGSGVLGDIGSIVASYSHTCATLSSGAVRCWGENVDFQIGNGSTNGADVLAPAAVKSGGGNFAGAVTAGVGYHHSCAIVGGGAVRCWGYNYSGQLGTGTTDDAPSAVPVSGLSTPALTIDGGEYQTCALLEDGTVRCWGSNEKGRLGNGESDVWLTPNIVKLPNGAALAAEQVSAGRSHTCARSAGAVRCWGYNSVGGLGNGATGPDMAVPAPVTAGPGLSAGLTGVDELALGVLHSCARMQDATVKCWGFNYSGQLGDQSTTIRPAPVDVVGLTGASGISLGGSHTCAIVAGGDKVACWGSNANGQFGDGTKVGSSSPIEINSPGAAVSHLALGGSHSCARRIDGTVLCWGRNSNGEVGQAGTGDVVEPTLVPVFSIIKKATAIAAGSAHTCAVDKDATVYCWGRNDSGQLGDGTTAGRFMPETVMLAGAIPLANVTDITAGYSHTCAISGGIAYCWGGGYYGQLGNGVLSHEKTPVPVIGPNGKPLEAVAISAGVYHTCARTPAGETTCWGRRYFGQVGDGVLGYRTLPVGVGPASGSVTLRDGGNTIATLTLVDGAATVQKKLGAGLHALTASFPGDAAFGPSSFQLDHLVTGTPGRDRINGGKRGDVLVGIGGNDRIRGRGGNDRIDGGDGRDVIDGGPGRDRLTGGKGRDTFVFLKAADSTKRRPDVITDFRKGDRIDLSRFDGDRRKKGRQRFTTWRGGKAFTGRPGELRFVSRKSRLEGDTNGDRRPDFRVVLKGVKTLNRKALKLD